MKNNKNTEISLPTYQDLFGTTEYHTVDPERSIFSPAAYLADLISVCDKTIKGNTLKSRRWDIWENLLSKENTETMVSKLEIV
ncbi:MAG: hypothetical protein ACN4GM_02320, partial [Gammaproteobacteria bacterium]